MGFAKRLFGPSRKEIWRKLSEDVGGRYVDGGFWKGDKVQVEHEDWTVTNCTSYEQGSSKTSSG
jgi:hypothetical protein